MRRLFCAGRRGFSRARMRDSIQEFCFFAVTSVTVDGVGNLFHPKNDGSFLKSDGLFCEK